MAETLLKLRKDGSEPSPVLMPTFAMLPVSQDPQLHEEHQASPESTGVHRGGGSFDDANVDLSLLSLHEYDEPVMRSLPLVLPHHEHAASHPPRLHLPGSHQSHAHHHTRQLGPHAPNSWAASGVGRVPSDPVAGSSTSCSSCPSKQLPCSIRVGHVDLSFAAAIDFAQLSVPCSVDQAVQLLCRAMCVKHSSRSPTETAVWVECAFRVWFVVVAEVHRCLCMLAGAILVRGQWLCVRG